MVTPSAASVAAGAGARNESTDASKHRVPVLIVGGSLVGLSASLFLGRLGVEHMLVERHSGTSLHPRGRGNNVRTMELFRVAGVGAARSGRPPSVLADNHGILQTPTLVGDDAGVAVQGDRPGRRAGPFQPRPAGACAARTTWSRYCWSSARELGGDLRFSTELMSFEQDAEGVTARGQEPGHRRAHHHPGGLPRRGRRPAQPGPRAARHRAERARRPVPQREHHLPLAAASRRSWATAASSSAT